MPVRMPAMSIVPDGREAQTTQALSPEPRCGQCGYCVLGIEGPICPECGSDLREVGVVTGPSHRPISLFMQLALWTLLLPMGAILLTAFLLRTIVPFGQTTKAHRTIVFQGTSLDVIVDAWGVSRTWRPALMDPRPAPPVEFELVDSRRMTSMQVNLSSGAYRYRRNDGMIVQNNSGFDGGVLADWLATGGSGVVNAADPNVRRACESARSALSKISEDPTTASRFTLLLAARGQRAGIALPANIWTTYNSPHPAVVALFAILWLSVWIFGIRRISRQNPPFHPLALAVSSTIHGGSSTAR